MIATNEELALLEKWKRKLCFITWIKSSEKQN